MFEDLKKWIRSTAVVVLTGCSTAFAYDLSSWQELALDFPANAGNWPAASWQLESGNSAVRQTVNADPSFFLEDISRDSLLASGTFGVSGGGGDDDGIGFVFGYKNSSNFYLFDWKRVTQTYWGVTGFEGMSVRKFSGATGDALIDLSLPAFLANSVPQTGVSVLATNLGSGVGWVDGRTYAYEVSLLPTGDLHLIIRDGATVLWEQQLSGLPNTTGRFGFFNNSQQGAVYSVSSISPIPEAATYAYLAAGLLLIGAMARGRLRR